MKKRDGDGGNVASPLSSPLACISCFSIHLLHTSADQTETLGSRSYCSLAEGGYEDEEGPEAVELCLQIPASGRCFPMCSSTSPTV